MSFSQAIRQLRSRQFIRERFNLLIIILALIVHLMSWFYFSFPPAKKIIFSGGGIFLGNLIIAFLIWQENLKKISQIVLISTLVFEVVLFLAVILI